MPLKESSWNKVFCCLRNQDYQRKKKLPSAASAVCVCVLMPKNHRFVTTIPEIIPGTETVIFVYMFGSVLFECIPLLDFILLHLVIHSIKMFIM